MTAPTSHTLSPDELQLVRDYPTSTIRELASRSGLSRTDVRNLIVEAGTPIRRHNTTVALAIEQQRRQLEPWKYGALDRYLNGGMGEALAISLAKLDQLPLELVRERLALFRNGRLITTPPSPCKD